MSKDKKIKIGISIGDYNGIGIEVILKTFTDSRMLEVCTPIIYGSYQLISYYQKLLHIDLVKTNKITAIEQLKNGTLNILNCWNEKCDIKTGESTPEGGKYAFISLKNAVEDIASNKIDALVTAPINKKNMQSEEFNFPGHTEYLANYANEENPLMIMTSDLLKIGLVSGHVPVKDIAKTLTTSKIVAKLKVFNKSLIQDFRIQKPKIAVLGLNPHAGDQGLLGSEEQDVIIPALKIAADNGILAFGPFAADGFFIPENTSKFDGVLAMYHDQGLIPFKALCFNDGVNYTAGLPIVRTSPDHGTAYDIAGKRQASEDSFRAAIYTAIDVFHHRKEYKKLTENPLALQKNR